jgi:hypothetical protein
MRVHAGEPIICAPWALGWKTPNGLVMAPKRTLSTTSVEKSRFYRQARI